MPKPKIKLIALCTPSLGAVSIWWTRGVMDVAWPLNMARRTHFIQDDGGDQVAETRNKIVAELLALENDHVEIESLFWVDDDVLIGKGALLALYNHHRPIVSGVYFTKSDIPEALIFPTRGGGTMPFVPNKTVEVWAHGMGLCLVKMEVYKRMLAECNLPKDKLGNPQWYKTPRDYEVQEGNMLSCGGTEDLYFLNAAGELGYKPLVDCGRHTLGWHYDLHRKQGYPREQFEQWSKGKPIVWHTPDGDVVWE